MPKRKRLENDGGDGGHELRKMKLKQGWQELHEIDPDEEYCERYVRDLDFSECDVLVVKSGMNTGKTHKMRQLISTLKTGARVLLVCTRVAFCHTLLGQLEGFVLYSAVKGSLAACGRLVVQYESLHRLGSCESFDLVVLDEVESTLCNVLSTETNKDKLLQNALQFMGLLRTAKRVLAMDADLSRTTVDVLRAGLSSSSSACPTCGSFSTGTTAAAATKKRIRVVHNTYRTIVRQVVEYPKEADWDAALADCLGKNERLLIVTTSKLKLESIVLALGNHQEIKFRQYHSGAASNSVEDFKDINAAWSDVDVVVFTSRVTCGADFSKEKHFRKIFVYASRGSVVPRIVDQMTGRARSTTDETIHLFVSPTKTTSLLVSLTDVRAQMAKADRALDDNAAAMLLNWTLNDTPTRLEWTLTPGWTYVLIALVTLEQNLAMSDYAFGLRLQFARKGYLFVSSAATTSTMAATTADSSNQIITTQTKASRVQQLNLAAVTSKNIEAAADGQQQQQQQRRLLGESKACFQQLTDQHGAAQAPSVQKLCVMLGLEHAADIATAVPTEAIEKQLTKIEALMNSELCPLFSMKESSEQKDMAARVRIVKRQISGVFRRYVGARFCVDRSVKQRKPSNRRAYSSYRLVLPK